MHRLKKNTIKLFYRFSTSNSKLFWSGRKSNLREKKTITKESNYEKKKLLWKNQILSTNKAQLFFKSCNDKRVIFP